MNVTEIIIGLAVGGLLLVAMLAGLAWVMSRDTDEDADVRKEIEKWREGK